VRRDVPKDFSLFAHDSRLCLRVKSLASSFRMSELPSEPNIDIANRILIFRGQRVLLDQDLALLYGVTIKRLNEQVRRNLEKFPGDFLFHLEPAEADSLRMHFATLKKTRGAHRKHTPLVFTEHGAIMAATVLSSPRAVQMSVYVVRAFVKLRQALASNAAMARRLEALERSVSVLDSETRKQFDQVYEAILGLMGSGPRKN
jgi:hypothetical protein